MDGPSCGFGIYNILVPNESVKMHEVENNCFTARCRNTAVPCCRYILFNRLLDW